MTHAEVIAAIKRDHLKANIAEYEQDRRVRIVWEGATVDRGVSLWRRGPYLKVPVHTRGRGDDYVVVRVYPPARLRRRLRKALGWDR